MIIIRVHASHELRSSQEYDPGCTDKQAVKE